jgi:ribose transport system substrate-binding protein
MRTTRLFLTTAATAALALIAGCGGSPEATSPKGPGVSSAPAGAELAALYTGTLKAPDGTPRPAAKGKKVVIISAGQASISSSLPSNAALAAAKAIGWDATIYDAQLNPANVPGLIDQAISSGANGIVLDASDCPTGKGPLETAKAKGVKVVGLYSFDCNDPQFGGKDKPLFSGSINYGVVAAGDPGRFTQSYAAGQAKAVIAATGGKAKVIVFNDPEFTILKYTAKGFIDEIKACAGCKIVAQVDFTGKELGPTLQQKAASVLLQHPEANAVKSPFTTATVLGIAPAVVQSGRADKVFVMGGEGFSPELDLMRNGQGVNAVMTAPSDWTGWAAVDTLNSVFLGKAPAESGLGWQLVDKTHNLPASGAYRSPVDYQAVYKKAWGIG